MRGGINATPHLLNATLSIETGGATPHLFVFPNFKYLKFTYDTYDY